MVIPLHPSVALCILTFLANVHTTIDMISICHLGIYVYSTLHVFAMIRLAARARHAFSVRITHVRRKCTLTNILRPSIDPLRLLTAQSWAYSEALSTGVWAAAGPHSSASPGL